MAHIPYAGVKRLALAICIVIAVFGAASSSFADVFGRLQFTVKNADDEKPIVGATITLHDTAGVHSDTTLTTDKDGTATSQPLEIRSWGVSIKADLFSPDTRQETVAADITTPIEVLMEPLKEEVIKITGQKQLVASTQTINQNNIDRTFLTKFPVNAGNPQSIQGVLATNPGMVQDSVNQEHTRGEHASTTINVDGVELPGANQGRIGQVITSSIVQNIDIMTGAYAPEYGGECAGILNVNLRSGSIVPTTDLRLGGGGFDTWFGDLTLSGQAGSPIDSSSGDTSTEAKRFGYFLDLSGRETDNAVEAPQPNDQNAHNEGQDENLFGNFNYQLGGRDKLSLTLNDDPAYSEIANRTGLSSYYASVGQGYGFGGLSTPAELTAEGSSPLSQEQEGQNINQRDLNQFSVLDWHHTMSENTTSLLSVAYIRSDLSVTNGNPAIPDLGTSALPFDNSIEYNPTLTRNTEHGQVEGSITSVHGSHTFKIGGLYDDQSGDEQYQFIPGSQLATDVLYTLAPYLAPTGTTTDGSTFTVGNGTGAIGGVYNCTTPSGAQSPVLTVHRTGYYAAAFAQDAWNITSRLTANYGLRFDAYRQDETDSTNFGYANSSLVNQADLSPRANLAYKVATGTVLRASYDRLFTQPPIAQGAILGTPILPQTTDQYELDLEHQVTPRQVAKISAYAKRDTNQIDVGLLIPDTQIGAYSAVNFTNGHIHGVEMSYDWLAARNNLGWSGYLAWTISTARPSGVDNLGGPVPFYNDHDQRNTVTGGVAYAWHDGLTLSSDGYYGSGTTSSVVFDDTRTPRSYVNADLNADPKFFGPRNKIGYELAVENIFNETPVINFDSGFSGTRFQEGRRIMLYAYSHF